MKNKKLRFSRLLSLLMVFSFMFYASGIMGQVSFKDNLKSKVVKNAISTDIKITNKTQKVSKEGEIIFSEDFDNGLPEDWLNVDADGDGADWWIFSYDDIYSNGETDDSAMFSYSWAGGALTPDNWLITPAIELTADEYMMFYDVYDSGYGEHYSVLVSTTDTEAASFTEILAADPSPGTSRVGVDLSDYAGETIYIAFRHHNVTNAFFMRLDNIEVGLKNFYTDVTIYDFEFAEMSDDEVVIDEDNFKVDANIWFMYRDSIDDGIQPEFTLAAGATVSPTTLVDFSTPQVFEVWSASGTSMQEWTVTIDTADARTGTDITTFDIYEKSDTEIAIDEENHTVTAEVWYMYRDSLVDGIMPYFTISDGATVDPEPEVVQDFSSPFTYTVTAEDETTTQDWVVTVNVADARTETDILGVSVANQVGDSWFDYYAKRTEMEIMYDTALTDLEPVFELPMGASIAPKAKGEDFTDPVVYTVTAEDETTTADWRVTITNIPPSELAEIEDFDHDSLIDYEWANDTALVAWMTDATVLTSLKPYFEVSFGAVIEDTTVAYDFSDGPVAYTVTAQDEETVIEYSVTILNEEDVIPTATLMAADTVDNVNDTVEIKSDFAGIVALVLDGESFGDDDDLEDLADDFLAVMADIEEANDTVKLSTYGLKEGWYFAYAIDGLSEYVSEMSVDSVYVKTGVQEVEDLAEIKTNDSWYMMFEVVNEVVLIVQTDTILFVQDESTGIQVVDKDNNITTSYNIGDGITGLLGWADYDNGMIQFVPEEDAGAASSTANIVDTMSVTVDELYNDEDLLYQSCLVKLEKIFIDTDLTTFDIDDAYYLMQAGSDGDAYLGVMDFDGTDLVGEDIPKVSVDIVGVVGSYDGDPQVLPRKLADITEVTGITFYKEDIDFEEVLVGDSVVDYTSFGNIGGGDITINAISFVGDNVFTMITELEADSVLPSYSPFMVEVAFEPDSVKAEEGMIIINWNTTEYDTIIVSGVGFDLPIWTVGDSEDFEDITVLSPGGASYALPSGWSSHQFAPYVGSGYHWGIWNEPDFGDSYHVVLDYGIAALQMPEINLSDATFPAVQFYQGNYFANYDVMAVAVSTDPELPMDEWDMYDVSGKFAEGGADLVKNIVPLYDYVGEESVYVRFYGERLSGFWFYWIIDDVSLIEVPNLPVVVVNDLDYLTTEVGESETMDVTVVNEGVSFVTIDSVYLASGGTVFGFDDDFDFHVFESYDADVLNFNITFTPTEAGLVKDTIIVQYSEAKNDSLVVMIALEGIGVACDAAVDALVGENEAPGAPMWYTYTPGQDMVITVSAVTDADPDTRLFVYANCEPIDLDEEGNDEVAHNEDYMDNLASQVHFFAKAGETYNIYWSDRFDSNPFTWTFEIDTTPGEVCEMAIPVTLPLEAFTGTTENVDDYYNDPSPCFDYYLGGNDIVYTFELEEASYLSGSIDGDYAGMHVIGGVMPLPFAPNQTGPACAGFASDGISEITFSNQFAPAGTYYIIVSTWPAPQFSEFTINLSAEVAHREATIMEIQGMDEFTPFEDTYVITTGIVTAVYENGYYIQDGAGEWNGIQVYDPDNYESVAVGDELRVDGKAKEYFDMTNIEDIVTTEVLSSDNDLPAVTDIDVDEVDEPFEGVLVTIGEVMCTESFNQYDEWMVEDMQGNELMIDSKIFKPDTVVVGHTYEITGVVNYSFSTWRIRPRGVEDILGLGIEEATSNVNFDVYPNPNDGEFTIDINTAEMNDLTIELVNIQGEVIYTHTANNVTSFKGNVNVTDFAKGVYYLRVFNGEEVKVEKVIVQ